MQRSHVVTLSLLLLVVIVVGLYTYNLTTKRTLEDSVAGSALRTSQTDDPATATYTDRAGVPVELADYLGEVVVVTTWASWCPQCTDSLAAAEAAAAELANDGIAVLALNRQESRNRVERYLSTQPPFEHLIFVLDTKDRFYTSTDGYAMPETVVFDSSGDIAKHFRGVFDAPKITEAARAAE